MRGTDGVETPEMTKRYVAIHRVFTGKYASRGYILDRHTGRVVLSCPHFASRWTQDDFGITGAKMRRAHVENIRRG